MMNIDPARIGLRARATGGKQCSGAEGLEKTSTGPMFMLLHISEEELERKLDDPCPRARADTRARAGGGLIACDLAVGPA